MIRADPALGGERLLDRTERIARDQPLAVPDVGMGDRIGCGSLGQSPQRVQDYPRLRVPMQPCLNPRRRRVLDLS